jgi:hypothetical protein
MPSQSKLTIIKDKQQIHIDMRKHMKIIAVSLMFSLLICVSSGLFAQTEAPPPPQTHGVGGEIPGGGAPIGEGVIMLIAMGAAYGARKIYQKRNKLAE